MRTKFLLLSLPVLSLLFSCKKDQDSKMTKEAYSSEITTVDDNGKKDSMTTTSMEKEIDGNKTGSYSYPYKATDGSRAKATFMNNGRSKTILIEANNRKFELDFKNKTPNGELYERSGISAESKEDSLIISQDNNEIALVKVKLN
jgi:major membrane immunogen (membrane-anchored lipoprotein)